ncbi:MAG: efflux RND transporter permease subunit [Gemmataceae bacterium]|nr:efflux RND transporter permease subunit [Gemmataceae bacterium]
MQLPELSIRNPVFAVMVSISMVVFGWLGYQEMGISQFPEVDFPVVSIAILREAASPDIMDGDVTDVVEDAVASVEGVDYIMSKSMEGISLVTVYFRLERNIDVAMQDIQNAVSAARRRLPVDIDPPVISKVNPNNLPVIWLTLSGTAAVHRISDFAEKELKQELAAIADVGGVQFAGLQARSIRIWVDRDKLQSFNLAADDVKQAIQRQHAELPAGYIQSKMVEFNLRTMGEAYSVEEMRKLVVAQRGGQQILLEDLAVVENGLEDRRSLARFNRLPAIAVGVRKAIGGNLVAVCDNVKRELPRLRKMLPPGVELHIPVDSSLFVRENIEELKLTLILGVAFTAIVCYLFLGSLGTTLNICLSIPTSLIGTFFILYYGVRFFGLPPFTLNLMTLLGLSLSVGVVVDDAILVLENIDRLRKKGLGMREAALQGAREISFAAIAATVSIVAIFLPVAFMSGAIGRFFFQFGVTVSVAVILSLICALTLTPMLCAFFLKSHGRQANAPRPTHFALVLLGVLFFLLCLSGARYLSFQLPWLQSFSWPVRDRLDWLASQFPGLPRFLTGWKSLGMGGQFALESASEVFLLGLTFRYWRPCLWFVETWIFYPLLLRPTDCLLQAVTRVYSWMLRLTLKFHAVVLGLCVAIAGGTGLFLGSGMLGRELVPSEDQSRLLVHVICPVGSSIEEIGHLLASCESILSDQPEVAGIMTAVATDQALLMNEADLFLQLVPRNARRHSQQELVGIIREKLYEVPDIRVVVRDQSTEGFTPQRGDPIDFSIQGDWPQLPSLGRKIVQELGQLVGKNQQPLLMDIDMDYRPGMPEVQIIPDREKLALLGLPVSRLAESMSLLVGGERVGRFTDRGRRYDIRVRFQEQERATPDQLRLMTLRAGADRLVTVEDVVQELKTVSTLPVINRYNHQRRIEIIANTGPGVSQGEAIEKCRAIAEKVLPSHVSIVELGNANALNEIMSSLLFALVLGIAIAYMILGVQFNSFIHPLTVLLAMPFAVTGALFTLWFSGDSLNMMSMIGLILLMGLVKKNSIILVDYTNQLREQGMKLEEAILQACPVRLRPILMTSIATIAGAIPAAVGIGPGAETRAPMAKAIIGGILISTVVTLFLVPAFYLFAEKTRVWASSLVRSKEEA